MRSSRALERARLKRENWVLRRALSQRTPPADGLVGRSIVIKGLQAALHRVAAVNSTVLLTGESGTGKELAALALHRLSPHAAGPFVPVNCATVSPALIEAELFGHGSGHRQGQERRRSQPRRPARLRPGRHAVPRRDRRAAAAAAGHAAAGAGGPAHPPGGQRTGDAGGRAHRRRHQPAAGRRGGRRPLPQGPVLPAAGGGDQRCRRCARTRKTFPTWWQHFIATLAPQLGVPADRGHAPTNWPTWRSTTGRATCASCAT